MVLQAHGSFFVTGWMMVYGSTNQLSISPIQCCLPINRTLTIVVRRVGTASCRRGFVIINVTTRRRASQLGHIEVLQELLGKAVALDVQDVNGWTPLMHACCRGHKIAVGALLAAGANVDIASHDGRTALHRAATWRRVGPLDQVGIRD